MAPHPDDVAGRPDPPHPTRRSDGPGSAGPEPALPDEAQAERIRAFWEVARLHTRQGHVPVYMGEDWPDNVPPPAWSFGDSPELADELLALVLVGSKTGTAALAWEYRQAGESIPAKGDLSIILDGRGRPAALIRTRSVTVVPFHEVTAEHAHAEGEGDATLESWRRDHETFWRRTTPEGVFSHDALVVCERFELLFAAGR